VNVALSVGNAVLAYNTACSVQNDPDMKALSENQDFPKAIADVNTTQSAYAALAKKVELLRQQSERSAVYANAHRKELAQMMSERDAAKNAGEGAQAALTGLCQQTLNAIQSVKYLGQYEAYLNGAKDSIAEKDIGSAIEKLQAAVVLPDCVKKNEALSLLKDAQTAQSSPQELLQGMSDTDFQSLCSTGTMPSSQKLSYDPLNAIYLQKLLAAKDSEASRRKAIQEEAERKAKATREEAQRKAEAKQKEQASQEESVRRAIAGDAAEPQLEGNDLLAWKLAYGQVIGDWYSGAFPSRPIRRLMTKNDNGSYVFLFSNLNEWVNNPYPNLSYAPHTMWEVIVMNYGKTLGVVRSSMKFLSPNQSMDEFNKLYSELFGPYIQTAPMSATANVPVKAAPKP